MKRLNGTDSIEAKFRTFDFRTIDFNTNDPDQLKAVIDLIREVCDKIFKELKTKTAGKLNSHLFKGILSERLKNGKE